MTYKYFLIFSQQIEDSMPRETYLWTSVYEANALPLKPQQTVTVGTGVGLQCIEESLRDEQAGLRLNRTCVQQANSLRITIEQSTSRRHSTLLSEKQCGCRLAERKLRPK